MEIDPKFTRHLREQSKELWGISPLVPAFSEFVNFQDTHRLMMNYIFNLMPNYDDTRILIDWEKMNKREIDMARWLSSSDPMEMHRLLTPFLEIKAKYDGIHPVARKLWLFIANVERLWANEHNANIARIDPKIITVERRGINRMEAYAEGRFGSKTPYEAGITFSYTIPAGPHAAVYEAIRIHNSGNDPAKWADLFREMWGNPFDSVVIDPRWLTSNVVDLAKVIYDEKKWGIFPILADALMDAGCDDEKVINHCRSEVREFNDGGTSYWHTTEYPNVKHLTSERATPIHVRGNWLIDQLLGKTNEQI